MSLYQSLKFQIRGTPHPVFFNKLEGFDKDAPAFSCSILSLPISFSDFESDFTTQFRMHSGVMNTTSPLWDAVW